MGKYELHYSKLNSKEINLFKYKNKKLLCREIEGILFDENCEPKSNTVYLISIASDKEMFSISPFISEIGSEILLFAETFINLESFDDDEFVNYNMFFLQEYNSYQEAYNIALSMMEHITDLCYEAKVQQKLNKNFTNAN